MIALELSEKQRAAVEGPFDDCFAIAGKAGTGKTTALEARIARARSIDPGAEPLVCTEADSLARYAAALLASAGHAITLVDDADAAATLALACEPLFALEWDEFALGGLDPEVPALRTPERFSSAAFRLIRRLRDGDIGPQALLADSLAAATQFYANPPNLADPRLLASTKNDYHDSLAAKGEELTRQYRREVDLAKILSRVYERYIALVLSTGRMTGRDAVLAARDALAEDPALAARLRALHRFAFVDDAERLTAGELHLLRALFGDRLAGVTLCGDPSPAIFTDRMTRPEATFAAAGARVELLEPLRSAPQIERHRAKTLDGEAAIVAERVRGWLDEGTAPERIAVLFRSVRSVEPFETALLERDVPCAVFGDANIFSDRRALDALALLWNVYDPFRHDWLLRTLSNPALGLSDASLTILCSEPPNPQRPLFALDEESAPTARPSRWDPKRDLRLGWNVIRGEHDDALDPEAASRVARWRSLRAGWVDAMHSQSFEAFARRVWREGLARDGEPASSRARAQQFALRRLLGRLTEFLARNPNAGIGDVLEYAERRASSELESTPLLRQAQDDTMGFVAIASIEAVYGREFDRVVVAGARAGTFPVWYAPDAFLYSPRLGMIPKENVGDARASRTAKFSYYTYRVKARENHVLRERRAFRYALTRARERALVTAWGTPTSGRTAPEFLEECAAP